MSVTVTLSKPVKAFGDPVTALTFREPTGRDLRKLRAPVKGEELDEVRMAAWIAELAAVPESTVDDLSVPDWMACATAISGFFVQPQSKS